MTDEQETEDPADDDEGSSLASVVLIDRREDIAAICGRVDTAPTYAVVIHAPNGNRQLSTELGMRRLQRHVSESGKLVAIATSAVNLAGRARLVGIPVARRPQEVRWDAGGRRVLRLFGRSLALPPLGRYTQLLLIAGVVAIVGLLTVTVVPSATITVYPPFETVSVVAVVTASRTQQSIDGATLDVPAEDVSAKQTTTLAVRTTGTVTVGALPATAGVTITNPTSAAITIPVGTVILGGPEFLPFLIDAPTKVPAGGSAAAAVTAERPGTAGNLPPGALSGWLDAKLRTMTVSNPVAAAGGTSEEKPAVAPADLAAVTALANAFGASETSRQALVAARPHDAVLLRTAKATTELGTPSAAIGTQADFLLLPVTVKVESLAVVAPRLREVAALLLRPETGDGELIPDSVTAFETGVRVSDSAGGESRAEFRIQGSFARHVTSRGLKDAVKGESKDGAKSTLKSRYGIEDVEVETSPSWAPWLPRFDFRMSVKLGVRPAASDPSPNQSNDPTPTAGVTPTASARP
ncbi:MAG: baseplate J/gp47 family protein [Anaerolineaceae bacterium]